MAEEEKPYRVYRARRGRKKVRLSSRGGLLGGAQPGAEFVGRQQRHAPLDHAQLHQALDAS